MCIYTYEEDDMKNERRKEQRVANAACRHYIYWQSEYPLYQAYSCVLEWYATLVLSVAVALHCSQNSTLNTKLHAQQSFQSVTPTLWGKIFALVSKGYYAYLTLPLMVDFASNDAIVCWCLNLERAEEAVSVTTKSVSKWGISGEQVMIHRVMMASGHIMWLWHK